MAADEQQSRGLLQLRWNSHLENLQCLFSNLLEEELFVDVTLACDGGVLRAHRAVLSACSGYFRRVLRESTCKHPTVIMKDIHQREMEAILQFMYRGQIHVAESELPSLLRTARLLEVRGFSDDICKETTKENCLQPEKKDTSMRRKRKMDKPTSALSEAAKSLDTEENTQNGKEEPDAKRRSMEQSILSYVSRIKALGKDDQDTSPLDLSGEAGVSDCDTDDPASKASRSPDCNEPTSTTAAVTMEKPKEVKKEETVEQYPFSVLDDQGGSVVVQAVCPFCFKDCKRTAELRAHIRGHTGEKPFRCDICSAPFARSAHLKRHRRVHTGEKPFECHRCQKTFSRQDKLKLHMDRHRLRDSGGSKMVIGRPRKDKKEEPVRQESSGTISLPSPSSASPTKSSGSTPTAELGMGQFAFPGAPARPGPAQSPLSSLPFGDINYLSLLSLSQRAGDLPSPTMPHLLSPQTLQELQMMRKQSSTVGRGRGARGSPARLSSRTGTVESASETLLNLAQKAGEAEIPASGQI